MYPVSARFLQAIRTGGKRKTVADIYTYSRTGSTLLAADIPIASGAVTVDRNASNRRTLSASVFGDPKITQSIDKSLQPYGAEVVIRTGVVYPTRGQELVPLGRFSIETVDWEDSPKGSVVAIQGFDYSKRVQRAAYGSPWDYSGRPANYTIVDILTRSGLGWVAQSYDPTLRNPRLPGGTIFDGDRWEAIQKTCESIGAEAYFDANTTFVVKPIPIVDEHTTTGVWTVDSGANGVLVKASRSITRKDTFNHVICYGAPATNGTTQAVGVASDISSRSPTYVYGPFGFVTLKMENPMLTTAYSCRQAAQARLNSVTGMGYSVTLQTLGNPALEAGDIIQVNFPSGDTQFHLVDSFSIPLSGGEFTIATKTNVLRL